MDDVATDTDGLTATFTRTVLIELVTAAKRRNCLGSLCRTSKSARIISANPQSGV
jgi:hypothetical protein